jgi:pimeloyl-ACP methyl ester carboxylesterase
MDRRGIGIGGAACLVAAAILVARPDRPLAAADATPSGGARPGPAVLYAPPPPAPQLENRSHWFRAPPLLVSGAEAYGDGEYRYQDHLYDDYGAETGADDPAGEASAGDLTYPTERSRYGDNAADLVEFRVSVGREAVAYRVTLNTLLAADSTIVAVAFDTDRRTASGVARLPRDPGAPFPGTDEAITIWGSGAEHSRFGRGVRGVPGSAVPVTTALPVTADLEANQLTVVVPRSVSDPRGVWRATLAVGLYDAPSGGWLRPQATPSPTRPGGAGPAVPAPPGIFNVGFRFAEPVARGATPPDTAQATALAAGAPTRFARDLDFAALDRGTERTTVPDHGTQVRIFASHLALGEGRNPRGFPRYLGQLQPYSLTVPSGYHRGDPAPLTVYLHSLSRHHWQYHGSVGLAQLGEERGNLVLTPLARGVDGWYQHEAEYDTFEAWADVARHFEVDGDRVTMAGYSMGGYGTYRLATLYPDLVGAAMTVAAPPGEGVWSPPLAPSGGAETLTNPWLPNARHVPFLNVVAAQDRQVPLAGPRAQSLGAPELGVAGLEQLGYRYRFVAYRSADHSTAPGYGYDVPMAAEFLGAARVTHDPARVTFVYAPAADDAALGLIHDHAYWVSALRVAAGAGQGTIDVRSHAAGRGDPESHASSGSGEGPLPFAEWSRSWGDAPEVAADNRLTVNLSGLSAARLDVDRAGLDPDAPLVVEVTSDVAGVIHLAGLGEAGRNLAYGPGTTSVTLSPSA